jgi:hypothetical protein
VEEGDGGKEEHRPVITRAAERDGVGDGKNWEASTEVFIR